MAKFDLFKKLLAGSGGVERRHEERLRAPVGLLVLVVDDSPTIRAVLGKMLVQDGYEVIKAGDAEEAMALARGERPGLIFLDIVLPGVSGFAALRNLRRDPVTKDIPIVMMSGNLQATEQFYVQRFGADDFMKKPFGRAEVFERIRVLVHAGRLEKRVENPPEPEIPHDMSPDEWDAIPDVGMPDAGPDEHAGSLAVGAAATSLAAARAAADVADADVVAGVEPAAGASSEVAAESSDAVQASIELAGADAPSPEPVAYAAPASTSAGATDSLPAAAAPDAGAEVSAFDDDFELPSTADIRTDEAIPIVEVDAMDSEDAASRDESVSADSALDVDDFESAFADASGAGVTPAPSGDAAADANASRADATATDADPESKSPDAAAVQPAAVEHADAPAPASAGADAADARDGSTPKIDPLRSDMPHVGTVTPVALPSGVMSPGWSQPVINVTWQPPARHR